MKRLRLVPVLAVSALLVGSPKVWAAHLNNLSQQNINQLLNSNINSSNNLQNNAKNNNPSLNIPGNNVGRQIGNAATTDGYSYNTNTNGSLTIVALAGTLTIDLGGGKSVKVDPGSGTVIDATTKQPIKDANGNEVRSLKALLDNSSAADKQALISGLTASVQRHAQEVVATGSGISLTETAFMMKTLAAAVPADTMSAIMTTAVTTLSKSGGFAGGMQSNDAIIALIKGAEQGGATQSSMVAAANTGVKANNASATFNEASLYSSNNVNNLLVTTPVNVIDVSIVSKSN